MTWTADVELVPIQLLGPGVLKLTHMLDACKQVSGCDEESVAETSSYLTPLLSRASAREVNQSSEIRAKHLIPWLNWPFKRNRLVALREQQTERVIDRHKKSFVKAQEVVCAAPSYRYAVPDPTSSVTFVLDVNPQNGFKSHVFCMSVTELCTKHALPAFINFVLTNVSKDDPYFSIIIDATEEPEYFLWRESDEVSNILREYCAATKLDSARCSVAYIMQKHDLGSIGVLVRITNALNNLFRLGFI